MQWEGGDEDEEDEEEAESSYGSAICELYRHPAAARGRWVYGECDPGDDLLDGLVGAGAGHMRRRECDTTVGLAVAATLVKLRAIRRAKAQRARWAAFTRSAFGRAMDGDCAQQVRAFMCLAGDDWLRGQYRMVARYVRYVEARERSVWRRLVQHGGVRAGGERRATAEVDVDVGVDGVVRAYGPVVGAMHGMAQAVAEVVGRRHAPTPCA